MRHRSLLPRGSSSVELALLLPLLGLLFLFTIDFARLYYHYSIVTNCARNGALYGSDSVAALESPYPDLNSAALADATDLSPQPTVNPPTTFTDASGTSYIQVTVTYPFTTISNYPGLPNPIILTRTVQMRMTPPTPK